MELDKYGSYLVAAFAITWGVLGVYLLYLRSRLNGLRRALRAEDPGPTPSPTARGLG